MPMSLSEEIQRIRNLPPELQLAAAQRYISAEPDPEMRLVAETMLMIGAGSQEKKHLVVLVHGIRTFAVWQELLAQELRNFPNVEVFPIGYGFSTQSVFGALSSQGKALLNECYANCEIFAQNIRRQTFPSLPIALGHTYSPRFSETRPMSGSTGSSCADRSSRLNTDGTKSPRALALSSMTQGQGMSGLFLPH